MTKREFLHEISNHVATAKISIEILCESLSESCSSQDQVETAKAAMDALNKLSQVIESQR